jgi:predicted flap endonuclease-1-like 5' DNA nuclease
MTADVVGETAEEMEGVEPSVEEVRADLEDYLLSFGPTSEFRKPVEYIEGIGDAFGQKLRDVGIVTVLDLIVNGATRRGRKEISEQSGIAPSQILTWVNHVDLFRIKGIAQQYAELLEESGVDTVVELAQRNPNNLHKRMIDLNEQKGLVRRTPHLSEVEDWVQQAKGLRRLIYY